MSALLLAAVRRVRSPLSRLLSEAPAPLASAREGAAAARGGAAPAVRPLRPEERPPGDTSRKYVRVDRDGRAYATGRRKTAIAQVWLWRAAVSGEGMVTINGQTLAEYYGGHWALRYTVLSPFFKTGTAGLYSASARVQGGGLTGKAEAIRLGVATALQGFDLALRPALKEAGFLTRDRRKKERKKPGQAGARKKFAWVKR